MACLLMMGGTGTTPSGMLEEEDKAEVELDAGEPEGEGIGVEVVGAP
jgi:hypothetical protein